MSATRPPEAPDSRPASSGDRDGWDVCAEPDPDSPPAALGG
ncbi:hypothetical protein ACFUIY_14195 [Streptomyces griseorubiginosus]|nr:hypothetical protein [Streptomyces griseorubiginosus]